MNGTDSCMGGLSSTIFRQEYVIFLTKFLCFHVNLHGVGENGHH